MNEAHLNKYRIVQESSYCCIHLFIHLGAMTHVGKSEERGELTDPPLCPHSGSEASNSDHQTWWQVPLPADPFFWPQAYNLWRIPFFIILLQIMLNNKVL